MSRPQTDQLGYACVAASLLAGVGVLLLQLRTLRGVQTKDLDWGATETVGRTHALQLKALDAKALPAVLAANEAGVRANGVATLIFDKNFACVSDGLAAFDPAGSDERVRQIALLLQPMPKMEAGRRTTVTIARPDGNVRQIEVFARWVEKHELWVASLKWG